jgi:hypothetical protein
MKESWLTEAGRKVGISSEFSASGFVERNQKSSNQKSEHVAFARLCGEVGSDCSVVVFVLMELFNHIIKTVIP